MFRLIRFPSLLLLAAAAGCGQKQIPPDESYARTSGEVDTSLSPDLQAKQQALKSLLDVLSLNSRGLGQLPRQNPSLKFNESLEDFLEPGAIGLAGWDFDGQPRGNDVPVVLHLNLDATGRHVLEVNRVYTVSGPESRLTIDRKP